VCETYRGSGATPLLRREGGGRREGNCLALSCQSIPCINIALGKLRLRLHYCWLLAAGDTLYIHALFYITLTHSTPTHQHPTSSGEHYLHPHSTRSRL
jgi:hypothetical protein